MLVAAANESDPAPQPPTKTVYLSRVRRSALQNEPDSSRSEQQRETWQEDEARTQGHAQQRRGRSPQPHSQRRAKEEGRDRSRPRTPQCTPQPPKQAPPRQARRGSPGQEEDRGRSRPRAPRPPSHSPTDRRALHRNSAVEVAKPVHAREAPAQRTRSPKLVGAGAKSAGRLRPAQRKNEGRTSNELAARARTEEAFQERQYQRLDDYYQGTRRRSQSPPRSALRSRSPLGEHQSIRQESPDSSSEPSLLRAVPVLGPERPPNCSDDDQWIRDDGFYYLDGAETSDDEEEDVALARRTPAYVERISRLITRILRHSLSDAPHKENGRTYITSLTRLVRETVFIRSSDLKYIAETDDAARFEVERVPTGGNGDRETEKNLIRATRKCSVGYVHLGLALSASCRWIVSSGEVKKAGNRASKIRQKTRKNANIRELSKIKLELAKKEEVDNPGRGPPPGAGGSKGSKGSKCSDGKGKGKSKGKGKPKYGTCSVHDKQRLMDALSDDDQGGLCCKEDMKCKSSAADRAKDKGRA